MDKNPQINKSDSQDLINGKVNPKIQTQIFHQVVLASHRKILDSKKKVPNRFDNELLLPQIKPRDFTTRL
jgi:hypothetical protein